MTEAEFQAVDAALAQMDWERLEAIRRSLRPPLQPLPAPLPSLYYYLLDGLVLLSVGVGFLGVVVLSGRMGGRRDRRIASNRSQSI